MVRNGNDYRFQNVVSHLEQCSNRTSAKSGFCLHSKSCQVNSHNKRQQFGGDRERKKHLNLLTEIWCFCYTDPNLWKWLIEYGFHKMKWHQSYESIEQPCVKQLLLQQLPKLHRLLYHWSILWFWLLDHHLLNEKLLLRHVSWPPRDDQECCRSHRHSKRRLKKKLKTDALVIKAQYLSMSTRHTLSLSFSHLEEMRSSSHSTKPNRPTTNNDGCDILPFLFSKEIIGVVCDIEARGKDLKKEKKKKGRGKYNSTRFLPLELFAAHICHQ